MHTVQAFELYDYLCNAYQIRQVPLLEIRPLKHNLCYTHWDSCNVPSIILNEDLLPDHVPHSLASILIRELAHSVVGKDERPSLRYHILCNLMFAHVGLSYKDQDTINYHPSAGLSWLTAIAGRWLVPRLRDRAAAHAGGVNSMLWSQCESVVDVAARLVVPRDPCCALLVPERLQEAVIWAASAFCAAGAVSVALNTPLAITLTLLGTGLAIGCVNHFCELLWFRATRLGTPKLVHL